MGVGHPQREMGLSFLQGHWAKVSSSERVALETPSAGPGFSGNSCECLGFSKLILRKGPSSGVWPVAGH